MASSLEDLRRRERTRIPRECAAPGCPKVAAGVRTWCLAHGRRVYLYGHHSGRAIHWGEYLWESGQVEHILEANPDHPGAEAAIDWFDRWLRAAVAGEDVAAAADIARLAHAGITGYRMLVAAAAMSLFALNSDEPALGFAEGLEHAIGHAVLKLVREHQYEPKGRLRTKPVSAKAAREAGKLINSRWAGLFANLRMAVKEREKLKEEQANNLKGDILKPFRPTRYNAPHPDDL